VLEVISFISLLATPEELYWCIFQCSITGRLLKLEKVRLPDLVDIS